MRTVGYCSPFVPPEWIAAHGLQPRWLRLRSDGSRRRAAAGRATCPYAGTLIDEVLAGVPAAAVILTTICDQMRYAAAVLEREGSLPVFLMNVPSTWQTTTAAGVYRDELQRLGRFLVQIGGRTPSEKKLAEVMVQRGKGGETILREASEERCDAEGIRQQEGDENSPGPSSVPLAIVGGPLLDKDYAIFDRIEQAGGRVVLDATESGERTLPAPFDRQRLEADPLGELVRAYFGTIPDVFRRPNDGLYQWLEREVAAREVRGMILHRYVWCDLWHAELFRLKEWSPVPVLEIDACDDEESLSRAQTRVEAFVETLR
jgi:benzoyl-CoA reductase/2-hydroxyglutaryl-CoA dehydratase subunit BcrC/BadD/HgdB